MARDVTVRWSGGLVTQAEVGPHRVTLDGPPESGGADSGPSPGEMLLGALGA
ncbi:MAG TPA: hypothetical protein VGR82_19445 [Methylomirabilota bacterium]|jgi:uncharacterized OsmC-like protein|nr:hypothetical protein [Methylomirabilota bacterium]HEV8616247.1 hypothetical protein [Methylomirabilota bacterium]